MSKTDTHYTPGVCNLNPPESAYRRKFGHIFAALSAVSIVALIAFSAPAYMAVVVFILVFLASISYLQARNNFCVSYASSGKFNASDEYADVSSVSDKLSTAKDKQKARSMYMQAVAVGAVAAILTALIL